MDNFREPTEEQIKQRCDEKKLDYFRNVYVIREELRVELNGNPPWGSDWGLYWKYY